VGGLVVFLVLTPCLGFAAGDLALQFWNKHPRHAKTSHTDSFQWKTTPGILVPFSGAITLGLVGPAAVHALAVATVFASRPPFVPPRV
jgi:hypothetical protein